MKVRCLTEAIFKNPVQAKAKIEKEKEMSNAEKLAGTTNKIILEPVIRFLNDELKKLLEGPHKHRYCTTYMQAYRHDPLCIAPDFIVYSYCIVKDKDIYDMWYEYESAIITDIDIENKKIDFLISLGEPHSGLPRTSSSYPDNNNIVYATYIDKLSGLTDISKFTNVSATFTPTLPMMRSPFPGSNIKILKTKLNTILRDIVYYAKENNSNSEYIKKVLDNIRLLNLLEEYEFQCKIEWNLKQDMLVLPIISEGNEDFQEAKGNASDALEYLNSSYYPMNIKYDSYQITYEERYGTPEITIESLIQDIRENYSNKPENVFVENKLKGMTSMENLAALYAESIKNLDLNIVGGGHIYLSTGYFKKNYLIV